MMLATSLNVSLEVITNRNLLDYTQGLNFTRKRKEETTKTEMLNLIQMDVIDTCATSFVDLPFRTGLEFSNTLFYTQTFLLHGRKKRTFNSIWLYFKIYDKWIWFGIVVVTMVQSLFYFLQSAMLEHKRTVYFHWFEATWKAIQLLFFKIGYETSTRHSVQLNTFLFSFLQSVVIMGVYSSLILSDHLRADPRVSLHTFDELIRDLEDGRRYFATDGDMGWFYAVINNSHHWPYVQIRSTFRSNPIRWTQSQDEALELAVNDRGIVVINDRQTISLRYQCSLISLTAEEFLHQPVSLPLKLNSVWLAPINRWIEENAVHIIRLRKKYLNLTYEEHNDRFCRSVAQSGMRPKPIYGLCFIVFVVEITALVIFLVEFFYLRSLKRK
ncbi:hypothetical protein M3Y98_00665000 [Aphelenchoides besseyi]|nr:hypothetical protein M3Y98_00665000 [Aphelenchoides besseyi]